MIEHDAPLDIPEGTLIGRLAGLETAVISDTLDKLGYRDQIMAARVRPLYPEARAVGRARTVRAVTVNDPRLGHDEYSVWIAASAGLGEGDVLVVSTIETCFWGEFVSMAAMQQQASGVVIDGFTRDALAIAAMRFPTFVAGIHTADLLGRIEILEIDGQIESGGVAVRKGDLVFADYDGVAIIPTEIAEETIVQAEKRLVDEAIARKKVEQGTSLSDVFQV